MIQLGTWSLIALGAACLIVGFGIGTAMAMAQCHHPEAKPPPLKEN